MREINNDYYKNECINTKCGDNRILIFNGIRYTFCFNLERYKDCIKWKIGDGESE